VTLISFNGHGGRQGNFWTVYLPTSNGYVKSDDSETTLMFRSDLFFVGFVDGKYGLISYAPGKGGGDLNLYQIANGKITKQKIATLDLSNPKDKTRFVTYFGEAPDWNSLKNYPVKTLDLDSLRHSGYDVDAAIKAAKEANHPLRSNERPE
jgi:hypothetical protein